MTIDYTKPALPNYLTTAMKHAGDMMDENRRIDYAISSVEERLASITQEIPTLEDTLGDMEADALLKRKPDSSKLSKTQDELQALHAEQRKLQSAGKSLRQKKVDQEDAIVDAHAQLITACREFTLYAMDTLDAELKHLCAPLQDVLQVARTFHTIWDHTPLRTRYQDANLTSYKNNLPLLGEASHPEPSEVALAWQDALAPTRALMDRIRPMAQSIEDRQRQQRDHDQEQCEREERLKPRVI
jgi:hypothetical protein